MNRKIYLLLLTFASCIASSLPSSLKADTIGDTKTSIEAGDYALNDKLTSIEIPNSVTSIGDYAFSFCHSLKSIKIPNSVTSIGNQAFGSCSSLTSIKIPNSVKSIGNGMFWGCTSMTSVEIPNSVTSIGNQAFKECSSLTSIEIPNSVARIEREAFYGCYSLEQINVANDNPYFVANDGVLFDKSLTKLIAYPTGKASVSYVIPEGVLTIEPMAFFDCKHLVSITLPESMEPNFRFYHCTHLVEIHLRNKFPTAELERRRSWYFKECTLYIPKGAEEAYSRYNLEEIFKEVKSE